MAEITHTTANVLSEIEGKYSKSDKIELSDDQMEALGIWTPNTNPPQRQAIVSGKQDGVPQRWKLYNLGDVDGYSNTEWLALEIHTKQKGKRYTRPYCIGIGELTLEPASNPSLSDLKDRFEEKVTHWEKELTPNTPTEEQFNTVLRFINKSDRLVAEQALYEDRGTYAAVYDGTHLYTEPTVGRWEGYESMMQPELTDDQLRVIKEVGIQSQNTAPLNTNLVCSFKTKIIFE
jgi:hypothetical protein